MTKRLFIFFFLQFSISVPAQSITAEPEAAIAACASLARLPDGRSAGGVRYDKLQPELAIPSCREAQRQAPSRGDVLSNLARALARQIDQISPSNIDAAALRVEKDDLLLRSYNASDPQGTYLYIYNKIVAEGALKNLQNQSASPDSTDLFFLERLRRLADDGYPPAQSLLGWCFIKGVWTKSDKFKGFRLIKSSADGGWIPSQLTLGILFGAGVGTTVDLQASEIWLNKSANNGDPRAMILLGWEREKHGEPKAASSLYRRALDQGYGIASIMLDNVELIALNSGVDTDQATRPRDPSKAENNTTYAFDIFKDEAKIGHINDDGPGEIGGFGVSLLESSFPTQSPALLDAREVRRLLAVAATRTGLNSEDAAYWMARLAEAFVREHHPIEAAAPASYCNLLRIEFVQRGILEHSDPRLVESYELLARVLIAGGDRGRSSVLAMKPMQEAIQLRMEDQSLQDGTMADDEIWLSKFYLSNLIQPQKALPIIANAVALRKRLFGENNPKTWESVKELLEIKFALGELDEAAELIEKHLRIATALNDFGARDLSWSYALLGTLRENQGAWDKAAQAIQFAYNLTLTYLDSNDPKTLALGNKLVFAMWSDGRTEESLNLAGNLLRTEELSGKNLSRDLVNRTRKLLVDGLIEVGRLDAAEKILRHNEEEIERDPRVSSLERIDALHDMGYILERERRFADAESWRRRGVSECLPDIEYCKYDPSIYLIANLAEQGKNAEAEKILQALRPGMEEILRGNANIGINGASTVFLLAKVEQSLGERTWSIHDFQISCRALREFSSDDNRVFSFNDYRVQCPIQLALALASEGNKSNIADARQSRTYIGEAFAFAQQSIISAAATAISVNSASLIAEKDGASDLAAKYERALYVTRSLAQSGDPDDKEDFAESYPRISYNQDQLHRLASQLEEKAPLYYAYRYPKPVTLAELQVGDHTHPPLLHGDEALILLVPPSEDNPGLVFAITRQEVAFTQIALPYTAMKSMIYCLRHELDQWSYPSASDSSVPKSCGNEFDRQTAYNLYVGLFGAPNMQKLLRGATTWMIATTGYFASVPYSALVTAPTFVVSNESSSAEKMRKTAWLANNIAIALLPDVSSLRQLRSKVISDQPPIPTVVAFADPLFKSDTSPAIDQTTQDYIDAQRSGKMPLADLANLKPLDGTLSEATGLLKVWNLEKKTPIYSAKDATKARLFALDRDGSLKNAKIIDLATHGVYAGQIWGVPEAALIMAGTDDISQQILTGSDAAKLHLSAEWVILSACNTASPEGAYGGGLSGLMRGFIAAGARALLVSQWSLNDKGTAELIPQIMRYNYDRARMTKAHAVQEAMLNLLHNTSIPLGWNPAVWAPFVLVGDPD